MGVHDLWSILGPVCESVPLYSLSGKTLAVDLSLWVCEAQHVQAMMGKVTKPHLRNLFFRVSSLTLMGIKLVFVMEGEAPKLKAETMSMRTEARFGGFKKAAPKSATTKNTSRGRFKAVLRECADMLDYLGVPWVTAAGEAEAMCAYLDSKGLVDGCITNDGDAFLYGARTVYRNFNLNTKDPQVDCYSTARVQAELHLSRENLVGLAILLGCDYIPKGVPGVGKEQALRLIQALDGQSLLQRFQKWRQENVAGLPEAAVKKVPHCNVCRHPGSAKAHERGGCKLCDSKKFCQPQDFDYECPCDWHRYEHTRQANSAETSVRKKTLMSEQFPFTEIINEFLVSKDKHVEHFRKRKPNMLLMQNFALDKMEWPKNYTCEKVLVLMTYTELMNRKCGRETTSQIKPLRILKPRVRNAVACFEVVWRTPDHYAFPEDHPDVETVDEVRTVEEEALFCLAYPEIVETYLRNKALAEESKTKKRKPRSKKATSPDPCDGVSDLLAQMTLKGSTSATDNIQPQAQMTSITNRCDPEVAVLKTPVSNRLNPIRDQHVLGDRPISQVHDVLSTLSPTACGTMTGSECVSPSVSAVIDALHLSDIDWEALSFTSSPPPQAATLRTAELKPRDAAGDRAKLAEAEGPKHQPTTTEGTEAESKPAPKLCYTECPLRDRVLMRNARDDVATQRSHHVIASMEPVSFHDKDPKASRQIDGVCSNDTKPSGKHGVFNRKVPLNDKSQSVTSKVDPAYQKSKCLEPLALNQCKANTNDVQKPAQNYTFVKRVTSSSVPTQRCQSDRKVPQTTKKKSVCVSVGSSSEDSDAENKRFANHRKAKGKPKSKLLTSGHKYFPLKPTSRVPSTKQTLDTHNAQSSESATLTTTRVDVQVYGSAGECCSSSNKSMGQDIPPVIVDDNVFTSPVSVLDSDDDSVICSDSPLPLAERLRLRFLK